MNLGTTLYEQLATNIQAGEEVRFSKHPLGLEIHRVHGDKHIRRLVDWAELDVVRRELCDTHLAERIQELAIILRGKDAQKQLDEVGYFASQGR